MDCAALHERARVRGVNPLVYWLVRGSCSPSSTCTSASAAWAASALQEAGVPAPTVQGLADVIAGRVEPADWSQTITAPQRPARTVRAA